MNDQQLIGATLSGGMQMTILDKTSYNSTIITIPLNTTYLPTGSIVSADAAERLYMAPSASKNASAIFCQMVHLLVFTEVQVPMLGKQANINSLSCLLMEIEYQFLSMHHRRKENMSF
jgi:hypothetical protein